MASGGYRPAPVQRRRSALEEVLRAALALARGVCSDLAEHMPIVVFARAARAAFMAALRDAGRDDARES
jgi:hypothetical protein